MTSRQQTLLSLSILLSAIAAMGEPTNLEDQLPRIPPRSPEEALAAFRLTEGLEIELVAHEPNVFDPVAMSFDEQGRIYVCEMKAYPAYAPLPQGPDLYPHFFIHRCKY